MATHGRAAFEKDLTAILIVLTALKRVDIKTAFDRRFANFFEKKRPSGAEGDRTLNLSIAKAEIKVSLSEPAANRRDSCCGPVIVLHLGWQWLKCLQIAACCFLALGELVVEGQLP